jgi:putative ABC transport system permease protein
LFIFIMHIWIAACLKKKQQSIDSLAPALRSSSREERQICFAETRNHCTRALGHGSKCTAPVKVQGRSKMIPFVHDIRFAFRRFRRTPGPFIAAIVTLALGIGANTAIFSVVDGISLRPLPIADPAHLVGIESVKAHAAADSERDVTSSFAEFQDVREGVPAFASVAAVDRRGVALETPDGLQLLLAEVVSDNYFPFMGVQPEIGRLPNENELSRLQAPVIVLSHGTWKRVFGGDPGVIGQTFKVKGGTATVLAVMPAGFRGTERMIDPQVYVPRSSWTIWSPEERKTERTFRQYELYARLRPGATLDQAKAQLQSLGADLQAKYPQANSGRSFNADWQMKMGADGMKAISFMVLGIAGCVLLIACANVANLLLAVNDARRKEIAMRTALGASRGQLVRQLITEYAVLAALGVAGALGLAKWVISLVPALMPNVGYPLGFDFRIDDRVLVFAVAAGVVSVLVCGLLPALATTRTSPLEAMRTQVAAGGKLKMATRKIFVVAEIAVSMALLMATGLLLRTLVHIETMNMGFDSGQNAALMGIHLDQEGARRQDEMDALVTRMKALPGAKEATVARVVPFPESLGGATKFVLAPGEPPSETAGTAVWFNSVGEGYFRAMSVPLRRGRTFAGHDTATSQRVAILNQTLAKKMFGAEDVVGRHLRLGRQQPVDVEIVGVACDGKYADVTEAPQPYLFLPLTQDGQEEVTLIVTTAGDPGSLLPAMRKAMREVAPDALILTTTTLTDHMQLATYMNRMEAWLSASLGALALLLTAVGLFGVTAYTVSRRTHEIGIRVALGARRGTVFTSVLKDGLKLALAGMVVGTGLAVLLGRAIGRMLYGVKPLDPVTLLGVVGVVLATSVAALLAPARRALRINPVQALREE